MGKRAARMAGNMPPMKPITLDAATPKTAINSDSCASPLDVKVPTTTQVAVLVAMRLPICAAGSQIFLDLGAERTPEPRDRSSIRFSPRASGLPLPPNHLKLLTTAHIPKGLDRVIGNILSIARLFQYGKTKRQDIVPRRPKERRNSTAWQAHRDA